MGDNVHADELKIIHTTISFQPKILLSSGKYTKISKATTGCNSNKKKGGKLNLSYTLTPKLASSNNEPGNNASTQGSTLASQNTMIEHGASFKQR